MEEKEGRERNAWAQENEYFTVSLLILKIVINDNTENGKVVTDIKNYCMMLYFETAQYYLDFEDELVPWFGENLL